MPGIIAPGWGTNVPPAARPTSPHGGLSSVFGPSGSQFMGSAIGQAFGAPTAGFLIGTGFGARDALSLHRAGHSFGPAMFAGSTAAGLMGAGPFESLAFGAGVGIAGRMAGGATPYIGMAGLSLAAASPITTAATIGFAASGFSGQDFISGVGRNILPGAVMGGAIAGAAAILGGPTTRSAMGAIAGNKWGRLGLLGASALLSGEPSITTMGAAGAALGGASALAGMTSGAGIAGIGGVLARHPYAMATAGFLSVSGIGAIAGMMSAGRDSELLEDEYGTYSRASVGMGHNFLNSAGMSLASHYNANSFSRR